MGSFDDEGAPWASVLTGEAGFIKSPTKRALLIETDPLPGDILHETLRVEARVGALGIEFDTRRRNRVNGRVRRLKPGCIGVAVEQSFGNCPQYITARRLTASMREAQPTSMHEMDIVEPAARALLEAADTIFIATSHSPETDGKQYGVDVSHRGGLPGFVKLTSHGQIVIPDYAGNSYFNTLGNIAADGRAGLLAIDFSSGDILQLTGDAEIDWRPEQVGTGQPYAQAIVITPRKMRLLARSFPFAAEFIDYSPLLTTEDLALSSD